MPGLAERITTSAPRGGVGSQTLPPLGFAGSPKRDSCIARGRGGLPLPELNAPAQYTLIGGERTAARLAESMLRCGVGRPEFWQGDAIRFITQSTDAWVADFGAAWVEEFTDLMIEISDQYGPIYVTTATGTGSIDATDTVFLQVSADAFGEVLLGPSIELLESARPGLGRKFYDVLLRFVNRLGFVYSASDAQDDADYRAECVLEGDDVEVPDIVAATPVCLRAGATVPCLDGWEFLDHLDGDARAIMAGLRLLETMSQQFHPITKRDQKYMDTAGVFDYVELDRPAPYLLVHFEPYDAISGCFDTYCESLREMSHEPMFVRVINTGNPRSVKAGFESLRMLVENLAMFHKWYALLPQRAGN